MTVLITGGCGDIGRAIGQRFAREGYRIAAVDLLPESDARRQLPADTFYRRADVTDRPALDQAFAELEADAGPFTVAVANAAVALLAGFLETSAADWDRIMRINLDGAFHTVQSVARRWVGRQQHGRLILIGSAVQARPDSAITAYCAAKAGLEMLARCAAKELAPQGITCNVVAPGVVNAGVSARILEEHPERLDLLLSGIPAGRLQEASEVAEMVYFLASPVCCLRHRRNPAGRWRLLTEPLTEPPRREMVSDQPLPQLHMRRSLQKLPPLIVPTGFELRTLSEKDLGIWAELLKENGELGEWNEDRAAEYFGPNRRMALERSYFVTRDGIPVATAQLHLHPEGEYAPLPELGWVAVSPSARGHRLGYLVCLAVLHAATDYSSIFLRTDDHRLPAIRTYLRLGFEPWYYDPTAEDRWRTIMGQLTAAGGSG